MFEPVVDVSCQSCFWSFVLPSDNCSCTKLCRSKSRTVIETCSIQVRVDEHVYHTVYIPKSKENMKRNFELLFNYGWIVSIIHLLDHFVISSEKLLVEFAEQVSTETLEVHIKSFLFHTTTSSIMDRGTV